MSNTKVKDLKKGDIVSETQYYRAESVEPKTLFNTGSVKFTNERGKQIQIANDIVEEATFSASQFVEEEKVTQTKLAELLSEVGDTVFEVSYQKLADEKKINEALSSVNRGSIMTNETIKTTVKTAFEGDTRILRGYLLSIESLMGRAKVVDLDTKLAGKGDAGIRLVDLRTINYLIFKGTKYTLKK